MAQWNEVDDVCVSVLLTWISHSRTSESETIQCVEVRRLYRFYDVLNGFCWEIFYSHIRIGCADWVWWLWLNKRVLCVLSWGFSFDSCALYIYMNIVYKEGKKERKKNQSNEGETNDSTFKTQKEILFLTV